MPEELRPGDRGLHVGLAVAPRRVVAVTVRRTIRGARPARILRRDLDGESGADGWPALSEALADLRDVVSEGGRPLVCHVAVLPPLARTKVVRLPAAGREELRRLAAREADRHFLEAPEDPVADAAPLGRWLPPRGATRCVTACSDAETIGALLSAVRSAGGSAGLVAPGAWALAEGAAALRPGLRRGEHRLRIDAPGGGREVRLRDGRLAGVQPVADAGRDEADARRAEVDAGRDEADLDPPALAAFGALTAPEDGPVLLPGEAWTAWRRRGRTRTLVAAAVGLLLLGVAALLHLWGLDREIRSVETARAEHSEAVERAAATRAAALRLRELVAVTDSVRPRGPSWTRVLAEVGDRLPPSAYLEALEAGDGTVRITGRARSPSGLVPRLEDSPVVAAARLESSTRSRDRRGGQTFRIVLTLVGGTGSGDGP